MLPAVSNRRLVAADNTSIAFRCKDYRINGPGRCKTMRLHPHEFIRRFPMHVLPKGFHRIRRHTNEFNNLLRHIPKLSIAIKEPGNRAQLGGLSCSSTERARSQVDRATGPRPARAPHPASACIQKARPDLGIGHPVMLPDPNRSSIWTGELEPAPLGSDVEGCAGGSAPARLLLAEIVAIARAAGFRMLVMSRIRHAAIGLGGCGPGSRYQ